MEPRMLVGLVLLVVAAAAAIGIFVFFFRSSQNQGLRGMMPSSVQGLESRISATGEVRISDADFNRIKEETKGKLKSGKDDLTLDQRLFRAGIFSDKERADFYRLRVILPVVSIPVIGGLLWTFGGAQMGMLGILLGGAIGYQLPFSYLDRKIAWRGEEIMFFLPLVIEQISIGVSSSLDVGPCLQRVVQMADERDTHNVVTELLKYAHNYIKSGVPFEEAMVETGKASGHTELKHAFMYLAQVAKHGGEITRQLQELADSVAAQRQAYIEGKIKKLELVATGPVTLVFVGFMMILLVGFGMQLKNAF